MATSTDNRVSTEEPVSPISVSASSFRAPKTTGNIQSVKKKTVRPNEEISVADHGGFQRNPVRSASRAAMHEKPSPLVL